MAGTVTVPRKKKSSWTTPLLFLSFGLVFVVLFNHDLQKAMGRWVGYALDPVIGFDGRYPVLTIFLASVLLVILTTVIRHFLVDWTVMARTTEAVRSFQKEFMEARKANNTYKTKKLTEAQPEIMALQADMQKDQMKPMAFTMLLVIPLFAWLGTTMLHPVGFDMDDAPDAPVAVVLMRDHEMLETYVADPAAQGRELFARDTDAWAYALRLPGDTTTGGHLVLRNPVEDVRFTVPVDGAPTVPASAKVGDLAPGTYSVAIAKRDVNMTLKLVGEPIKDIHRVLGLVVEDGKVTRVLKVHEGATEFTLGGAAALYVVVPADVPDAKVEGASQVLVTGAQTLTTPLDERNVVVFDNDRVVEVMPFTSEVPWKAPWDLQESDGWLGWLPHWILLYSLFGIPFGQIAQRALKLWEYRKVDLDGDGVRAGEGA